MTLFNETLKQIQEKYSPVNDIPDEWNYDTTPLSDLGLTEEKLDFIGLQDDDTISSAIEHVRNWSGDENTFVIHNDENPIGIFGLWVNFSRQEYNNIKQTLLQLGKNEAALQLNGRIETGLPIVTEIILLGFKQNSITLVKDTFDIMDYLLDKYKIVMWSVSNKNDIKKAYDKMVKNKYHGYTYISYDSTYYIVAKDFLLD